MAQTITRDVKIAVPAPKVWEAFQDSKLLEKTSKPLVVSVQDIKGGGSVGSVRQVNLNTELVPFPYMKEELTHLDGANMTIGSSIIEGGLIGTQLKSQKQTITVKPDGDGCVVAWVLEYEPLVEKPDVEKVAEGFVGSCKGLEAYLQAS